MVTEAVAAPGGVLERERDDLVDRFLGRALRVVLGPQEADL